jgi:transposase
MTKAKRYKRYSSEFKREAILRAGEEGVTDRSVCDELGISTRQFRRWRDELQLLGDDALKRELTQVKKERDFLKEAAAYFARGSK